MNIAIIGGTGVDEMQSFRSGTAHCIETRYGSAEVISSADEPEVYFLPRHGINHNVAPAEINYRAQIAALKKIGVQTAIGVCAVGSLVADIQPGTFVILGDFIDLTKRRASTFFDSPEGPVVHTDFTEPYCPSISCALKAACTEAKAAYFADGVYVGVDGPRYESPAEIRLFSSWGGHVIGMTNLPEVILAREAGICYGAIGIATNMAAGLSNSRLTHSEVRSAVADASVQLQEIIARSVNMIPENRNCHCADNFGLDV